MTTVDKSRNPYFDDYQEDKHFHEILFVPTRAVQVRELNQIQSIFQKQIERFGNHVFKEGSVVIPGEYNYDLAFEYARVTIPNFSNISDQLSGPNIQLRGESGIVANVKLFVAPEESDPSTFYIEYLEVGSNPDVARFTQLEMVDIYNGDTNIGECEVSQVGLGSKFTINNGVYYIGGRFVLIEEQTVLLDKYNNVPSKLVGIEYNEVAITENDDASLFDNAQGAPNFTAPGAHRIRVDTTLKVFDVTEKDLLPDNIVEIFRIEEGEIQQKYSGPDYNILGDVLAQRTYEESGNYTVESFPISFDNHPTDQAKYLLNLGRGLAYVNGYRIESTSTTTLNANRARERGLINNSSISAQMGFYILVDNMNVVPNVTQLQQIIFYDNAVVTAGVQPTGTALGTASVRFVERDGGLFRLYLFNVRDMQGARTTNFIVDAIGIHSSSTPVTFSCNLEEPTIFDSASNSLIFPLNVQFVASLYDSFGNSDTSYASVKQLTTTTDSNGQVTISAAPNEVYVAQNPTFAFSTFTDNGEFVEVNDKVTLSGNPIGSIITIDYGIGQAGRPVRINLQVAKQEVQQKVKTITNRTASGSLTSGRLSLGRADVFKINSVVDDNGADITSLFTLYENKTRSYYDISYVETQSTVVEPITVNYDFFAHSVGDYFGVDSYTGLDYKDIPEEDGIRLSDVLDFRPRIADSGTAFIGTGASVGNIPTPFSIIRADVDHYLPRRDKVYISASGEFGVREGVPALDPKLPDDPAMAMVLYELDVPAYTFNISDIQAQKISNRRYTMKDIGKLDQRISNVEYYVTLNLLEQEAESKEIIDPVTGLNRFKNGFLTDSFIDHSVGDFAWQNYHVSVSDAGELRPEFSLYATDMEYSASESENVSHKNGIVTLPYNEISFINQNRRSTTINVNPYAVYRWIGDLTLTPSVDSWIDTVYTNPDVTYQVFNNGRLTQTWNSWQVNWTGGTTTQRATNTVIANRTTLARAGIAVRGSWMLKGRSLVETTTTTTTRTNVDIIADRVVDTSVIPYMRSIDVRLRGVGNRPGTRLHFFFDGVKINQWVRPLTGSFNQPVVASANGVFDAVFRIPNNNTRRFRTGDKILVATDQTNNIQEFATSYSESFFTSSGVLNTRQRTILATRHVTTTTSSRYIHRDPIAQSFVVERVGGVFVTSVNVFFSTKDRNVPVSMELREMENGIPTQRVVPGGIKLLEPSQVNVSANGTVATKFEFPYPVHLNNDNEYCFVLLSNSNLYNAHIATLGQRDKGTRQFIAEQPYSGVMFKSQNNSTWTEDQNSDIQFQIFCANFNTNVVGKLVMFNGELTPIQLDTNPFATVTGSSNIIINRFMHNYVESGKIEITGAIGGNGITAGALNAIHTIQEVIGPNHLRITVSGTADATGMIGGNEVFVSDTIQASVLNPNIRYVQLPDTGLEYFARGASGKSIDGSETPYQVMNEFQNLTNGEVNYIENPWLITNRMDEAQSMSDQRSVRMEVLLASNNPNISPVVDLEGSNIITPFSMITYPEVIEEDGSNNHANYRTRITGLRNPANSIRTYFDALRPDGSDVVLSARFGNSIEEIEASNWQLLNPIVADITGDGIFYMENEYALESVGEYTQYQLMIQLKSRSATRFPILKRLRVLALGT